MKLKDRVKAGYHWLIAGVMILTMLVAGGVSNGLAGVVMIPVTESLGISRGDLSLEVTIISAVGVILNMLSGALFIKFGYRKLISVSLILSALGHLLASTSNSVRGLWLAAVLEGMYGLCIRSGNPRILGAWFHRHYGTVMGAVSCMTGLGGSLFSIIFSKSVTAFGWRGTYRVAGFCILFSALLIAFVVRNRPSDMGLKPLGEGYIPKNNKKESRDHWEGFDMAELKKKPVFYLLIIGTFLSSACVFMGFYVITPHLQDCGMDPAVAAGAQSLSLFSLAACKLLFGYLSDKIGAKSITMISLVALVGGMLLLANVSGPASAYGAVLMFSLAMTLTILAPTMLTTALFGYRSGAQAMGIVLAAAPASNMLATPLTNTLRDHLGSYCPVFRGTAVVAVGVIVLYIIMYILAARERKKFEQSQIV